MTLSLFIKTTKIEEDKISYLTILVKEYPKIGSYYIYYYLKYSNIFIINSILY
jgi:hypothetical protein